MSKFYRLLNLNILFLLITLGVGSCRTTARDTSNTKEGWKSSDPIIANTLPTLDPNASGSTPTPAPMPNLVEMIKANPFKREYTVTINDATPYFQEVVTFYVKAFVSEITENLGTRIDNPTVTINVVNRPTAEAIQANSQDLNYLRYLDLWGTVICKKPSTVPTGVVLNSDLYIGIFTPSNPVPDNCVTSDTETDGKVKLGVCGPTHACVIFKENFAKYHPENIIESLLSNLSNSLESVGERLYISRIIGHEIGHAFGIQHVARPDGILDSEVAKLPIMFEQGFSTWPNDLMNEWNIISPNSAEITEEKLVDFSGTKLKQEDIEEIGRIYPPPPAVTQP